MKYGQSQLQKGVDFNSCYKDGRNYIFLENTGNGFSYNGKLVFSREELSQIDTWPDDKFVALESSEDDVDISEDELTQEDVSDEHCDQLSEEIPPKRNYAMGGTIRIDDGGNMTYSPKIKC